MPLLSCSGLVWTVGGARIVDGVDLSVPAASFTAVIGPNGAGKTSLFNLLSGTVRPTAGRITFAGHDVTAEPPHRRARRGITRTFQSSSVFPTLSAAEHVLLALRTARRPAGRDAVLAVLDRVRLAHRAADPAAALSHGDRRKLELGLALASSTADGSVLLLDEPMAGMSAEEVPELVELIRALHTGEGRTVLMVEHHMEVLLSLASHVVVLDRGRVLADGTPAEVTADPLVQQAYLGAAA